jgi:hypothetical protein
VETLTEDAPPELKRHGEQLESLLRAFVANGGSVIEASALSSSSLKIEVEAAKQKRQQYLSDEEAASRMQIILDDVELNLDEKLRAIYAVDNRVLGWDSNRWAGMLTSTPQAVRKTDWWKTDRQRLIGVD